MANIPRRRPRPEPRGLEDALDELELYEDFKAQIMPDLRKMLADGVSDKEILQNFSRHVSARLVTIALTDPDNARALSAVKDLLDRVNGRATEHKHVKHEMAELTDQQLDALLLTEIGDLDDEGTRQ